MSLFFTLLLTLVNFLRFIHTYNPIVEISDGKVVGQRSLTPEGKVFYRFQGIPYAAPPIGDLRFADPRASSKWDGVQDCRDKNKVCLQIRKYVSNLETEDCLVLNVYTPELPKNGSDSNLAVMVYFHGGGFYIGNSTYDAYGPEFFMEFDVVIVTVNYRLGPFGYLSTEDEIIPGNFGLKDQQLALKWIKSNIENFGGDPNKITIFGNSAGAASVGYHILNKENKGLFRAAIMSSGSPLNSWSFQRNPKKIAFLTAHAVNESKVVKNSEELLQFLRQAQPMDLRRAALKILKMDPDGMGQSFHGYFYAPVMDKHMKNGVVIDRMFEMLEQGNYPPIPIMMGLTSEEAISTIEGIEYIRILFEKFDLNPEMMVNDLFNIENKHDGKFVGNLIHNIYVNNNESLEKRVEKGIRFFSDCFINNGVLKFASLASRFEDVFLYQFSYDGLMGNYSKHVEGAGTVAHTEDMNYIWRRNLPTANNLNIQRFPDNDKLVQRRLLFLYTNFAKYLNPTPRRYPLLSNITWNPIPAKDGYEKVPYLDINDTLKVKLNLKNDTYSKWNAIFTKYAVKPHTTF